jgi:hypothetical protein
VVVVCLGFCLHSLALAYSDGSGTETVPYQIAAVSDWQILMNTSTDWSKHFILTADLDFNEVALTPVGNYNGIHFTGTLEGDGHTIRNADINIPDNNYVSLFGCV